MIRLFGVRPLEYTPRGDSLDSLGLRWRTWVVVARSLPALLWRHPFGRRPLGKDLRRYITATGASIQPEACFNEYLQVAYEHGVLGVAASLLGLGALGWALVTARGADPFVVALLTWALTMTGSITLRTWPFPLVGALLILGAWA